MRHTHNLSHTHKFTCDMGQLIPAACVEVLPGDTFTGSTRLLSRVAPLVAPTMHNVELRVHHWYMPNRLLWSDWEKFIVGDDTVGAPPMINYLPGLDWDLTTYLGIPSKVNEFSAFPIEMYNRIWNDFYRDQELQTPRDLSDVNIARICWGKDYFTTARPNPQIGQEIGIGLSGNAPITGLAAQTTASPSVPSGAGNLQETGWKQGDATSFYSTAGNAGVDNQLFVSKNGTTGAPEIYADLTQASSININELRQAIALQRFAEARMWFGDRYVDYLRFLGVNPSDGRLDRAEYLGGGSTRINFSEVLATAEGANTNVGDMSGHGIASLSSRRYRKTFEEHGFVMTLFSARPAAEYTNGIDRKYTRTDPMDYWQKELEVLPWQEVKNKEVYADGTVTDDNVFGYAPRYDEYRHERSYVSAEMTNTRNSWHMARSFDSLPTLNSSFVECTPTDRIYADKNEHDLIINASHRIVAKRLVKQNAGMTIGNV